MTNSTSSIYLEPSTNIIIEPNTRWLRPRPRPRSRSSGDASFDHELPKARSNNIQADPRPRSPSQSIPPIRTLSTRTAPCLPSTTSLDSQHEVTTVPEDSLQLNSKPSSTLRASIARLESLLHEAACLAESAITHEDQENKHSERHTPNFKSIEHAQSEMDGPAAEKSKKAPKVVSRRPSMLTSNQSFISFAGLPMKKAGIAAPILTIHELKSTEDVAWTPNVECADHKPRADDIQEHLHNWACPDSRRLSIIRPGDSVPLTDIRVAAVLDLATAQAKTEQLMSSLPAPTEHPRTESAKVQSEFSKLVLSNDQSSEPNPQHRKPSVAPSVFIIKHEPPMSRIDETPSEPASPELDHFDEPPLASTNSIPKLRLNDEYVDDWDAILEDKHYKPKRVKTGHERHFSNVFGLLTRQPSVSINRLTGSLQPPTVDLRRQSYVDVYHGGETFDVKDTVQQPVIARNWPNSRKRMVAFVACMNTSCIGLLLGIYAGEVPAIQYAIADFEHYTVLGNVVMYAGLAISTFSFWPLPLLHGRKPYMIFAGLLALVLQVPQGLAVAGYRDPSTATYKALLLASRCSSGLVLGLSDMNLKAMLLDCFGSSLQSQSTEAPERFDIYDVRKHGGGMGMWLGFVAWSMVGPISIGFMIGASIIDNGATVSWGFWISLCILSVVLLLNILAPEVRRSAFRRTIAELNGEGGDFSRIVRGEIKMHLTQTGPVWWGEEVIAGVKLCLKMMKQPGFLVLSLYAGWIYAQYSLVLMLLGALVSKSYHYYAVWVGLCTLAPALGAIFAAPFQRASYFSRSRTAPSRSDTFTMKKRLRWSSHFIRRLLSMILLPLCAAAYAGTSLGPPLLVAAPCIMAALVGFFTTMATAECYGLIMEAFDTTDLQPGMTGRPIRASANEDLANKRTNFSCYPRVMAGFTITQTFSFILAAVATGVCGAIQRREGTIWATTGVAVIDLALTLVLTAVLVKWKKVQMVPNGPETFEHIRRANTSWRPVILGRPSGKFRRLSIFEMGRMTRYSQIRERNRLEGGLSGGVRS